MTLTAQNIAHAAIIAAGFTPCPVSGFVHNGRVFAFSAESALGFSASGPAFEIVVDIATGEIIR